MKRSAAGAAAIALASMCGTLTAVVAAGDPIGTVSSAATVGATATRVAPPAPTIAGCPQFPPDNPWNQRVDGLPIRAGSAATIARIQADGADFLHADFGENPAYGIPFVVVPETQPLVPVRYTEYPDESDPGPFPIPDNAPIEGGSDRHLLVVQQGTCRLHEFFVAGRDAGGWFAGNGATFDLRSNALRPDGWTSADAAGLAILPGLVRCEEMNTGRISHAIRVTFTRTQRGYIHPATHFAASNEDPDLPPMGLRLRLRADFDVSAFTGQARVLLETFRTHGLIVADNGSNWYFQGAPGDCWDDTQLDQLKRVPGTAFEVVETGPVRR